MTLGIKSYWFVSVFGFMDCLYIDISSTESVLPCIAHLPIRIANIIHFSNFKIGISMHANEKYNLSNTFLVVCKMLACKSQIQIYAAFTHFWCAPV